ncbi:MAG: energy transducer TonB [bacterium]
MKTYNLNLVSLSFILVAALMVGLVISRPLSVGRSQVMPVFMGEEISAVKAKTIAIAQPVPQPKVLAPMPIVPPSVSYSVLPEYPVSALRQGIEGVTVLSLYVGLNGAAEKVAVKSSSGTEALDQSAVAAVSQWQFAPASQAGAALASWFEIPVRFEVK